MEEQQNEDLYPLDKVTTEVVAEMNRAETNAQVARQTALAIFARQHNLQGEWMLEPNGCELRKKPQPVAAAAPRE